jgi:flagellar hook-basal body complex protein FliE
MNVAGAISAYSKGGGLSSTIGGSGPASEAAGGSSFGDVLKNYASDTVGALQESEKAATSAALGKSNLTDVVAAISKAELMLQTVVTIRDKVIAAYQDITKTAI